MPHAITLRDAQLTLPSSAGPIDILRDISLEIQTGESVGLIGPSGSGKTSLLMLMGGLERATSGQINIMGQDIDQYNENQLAQFRRDNMGVVFQSFHLIPTMTALENVIIPLELSEVKNARHRAQDDLDAVGLSDRMHHYPAQLSGGEQQRVALARAMAARPKILLADEPTGNLDARTGTAIMDLIFNLGKAHNTTLVLVTHAPDLASRCDRVIALRDGQLEPTL